MRIIVFCKKYNFILIQEIILSVSQKIVFNIIIQIFVERTGTTYFNNDQLKIHKLH